MSLTPWHGSGFKAHGLVAFDALFKKYFVVVVLGFIALAAYFEAKGATQLVGAALLAPVSSASGSRGFAPPLPTMPPREPRSAEPIIDRNPFDSVTGPLHPKPDTLVLPKAENLPPPDPLASPACEGVAAFIITESTDRLWSVAALQGNGEPHPRMRRVGDEVSGKQVAYIGFNPRENSPAVWLTTGEGQLCQVLLFKVQATPAPPAAPAAAAPPPPPAGAPGALPADIASKIQRVSENEFNVDRSVVDKVLENQAELMKSARIVPESKDGKVVGIRLFGIRNDTLLGALGLQNGDRLEAINGFNMASPEKALEAYARLRTASNLTINLNRRGAPQSLQINIK